MADNDVSFLRDIEGIRSQATPASAPSPVIPANWEDPDWLNLREANQITGIPVETLRKWARKSNVPSYLKKTELGQLRMISLEAVLERAKQLGREILPEQVIEEEEASVEPAAGGWEMAVPPGTMLVPMDAWDKLLMQLGNLHQAGQDLAEARERAARAETEVAFLKERLAEVRQRQDRTVPVVSPPPTPEPMAPSTPSGDGEAGDDVEHRDLAAYSAAVVRHLYSTWRNRPRR